jgi:hypothetical protein
MQVTIVAANNEPLCGALLCWPGVRGLCPGTRKQEQNRHPPIFARCGRCQTGWYPVPIFFLPPAPGLADGRYSAALRKTASSVASR